MLIIDKTKILPQFFASFKIMPQLKYWSKNRMGTKGNDRIEMVAGYFQKEEERNGKVV